LFSNDQFNPTGRFTGLAECYARNRPSYPPGAIDCLIREANLTPNSTVVDVGCGTGIATRLLAERGLRVIGVEPNADMLNTARITPLPGGAGSIEFIQAKAESTGLQSGAAAAVTAFQAFHWFDQQAALAEFHRILKPGGQFAIAWNDRDDADPMTAQYDRILRVTPEAAAMLKPWQKASDILFENSWFNPPQTFTFPSEQILDEEGLVGRALSASYAPREPAQREQVVRALRDLFARYQSQGTARIQYQVSVFLSRRRPPT
jgi:ubiquinone/menaquinone biosynthesis C-methylase UbiE